MRVLQPNNKVFLIIFLSALVLSANAAYINIGINYSSVSGRSSYLLSLDKELGVLDLCFSFYQDSMSVAIISPQIWITKMEMGYKVNKEDLSTLYKGSVYFGLCQTLEIGFFRIMLQEEMEQNLTFNLNGVIGIEF